MTLHGLVAIAVDAVAVAVAAVAVAAVVVAAVAIYVAGVAVAAVAVAAVVADLSSADCLVRSSGHQEWPLRRTEVPRSLVTSGRNRTLGGIPDSAGAPVSAARTYSRRAAGHPRHFSERHAGLLRSCTCIRISVEGARSYRARRHHETAGHAERSCGMLVGVGGVRSGPG